MAESHVMSALKQKRAAIAGEILAAERRIGELRASLVHLDGAMRLFAGDDINPEAIPPRLPRPSSALPTMAPRGDMTRTILDTLRAAAGGISLPDITTKAADMLGVPLGNDHERQILAERVRNTLYRIRDKGMAENYRDQGVIFWRLTE